LITLLVSKHHLGRANGMVQFGQAASEILAPALAGVLVLAIQVQGVLLIDFITFIFASHHPTLCSIPPAGNHQRGAGE